MIVHLSTLVPAGLMPVTLHTGPASGSGGSHFWPGCILRPLGDLCCHPVGQGEGAEWEAQRGHLTP